MSKILVTYFSASGKTKKVAQNISEILHADLFEIEPKIPYTKKDLNWMDKKSRSSLEMKDLTSRPEISRSLDSISDYETVFVGFPIWWYVAPTIINTFLESYDFKNKTIILFATSGSSGFGETLNHLKASCPGAILKEGKVIRRFQDSTSWLKDLEF